MARQETIEVKLAKSQTEYSSTLQEMKNDAKDLKKAFGDIKIGNSAKLLKEQAAAEKEAAKAATEKAKAEKEAANAEKARIQVIKESANAEKAKSQAAKEANNATAAELKIEKEAANALKAKNQATKEMYNAQKASLQVQKEAANVVKAHTQAEKAQLSLNKQLTTSNHALASSVKTLVLQYISLQTVTRSLRYALNEMKDMSDEMAIYRKVTNATAEDMEKIRAAAYDTAKKYGQAPSDVIASAANMARAGYRDNAIAMAELATRTQLVGDMTADTASKFLIAVDAAYKYGGSIEKLSSVLDAANEIDNNFATSIEKISDGMTLVASLASSAHVPVEQLMAALGTVQAVTQRSGQETGRAIRSIILNVLGDTTTEIEEGVTATEESVKSMTDALMKYGDESIKASIKAGKLINPMEAIVALQKAWKNNQITEQDLFQIGKDVAGQRYYNIFSALIQNPEMYNSMLESIANSAGSAQKEIDALMDSWSKKLEKLKTTWIEMVNKSISEGFIKDLIDGSTHALEFAGSLENLAIMALGAYEAIKSLSYGIKNLRMGQSFGTTNLAFGLVGVGISVLGYVKSAYENAQRELVQSAVNAGKEATEALEKSTKIESIVDKYKSIVSDGIQPEKGELEQLKTLQDELNELIGDQASAIDIVNGKYDDTLEKLKNITEEQRAAALTTAEAKLTETIAALKGADWNGLDFADSKGYSSIANYRDLDAARIIANEVSGSTYFSNRYKEGLYVDSYDLIFKKPETLEEIIAFNEELDKLYTLMGTTKIGDTTFGEKYSDLYNAFNKFREIAKQSINPVLEANEAVNKLANAEEKLNEVSETTTKSEEDAGKAMDDASKSADKLADSINAATTAKEKFDDAMKTTKADAFNDYMAAFDTFKKEIDEGRVNSTAMYAAARMLLGDEAYNATGGTYAGVQAAMNRRGNAGSVMDAYNILNTQYVDANGNDVIGAGVYELIRKSGIIPESRMRDAEGNYYIPNLTDIQVQAISKAYGGIAEEVIYSALNAFDQYDKYGTATDANVQTKTEDKGEEENPLGDSSQSAAEAIDGMTSAATAAEAALSGIAQALDGTGDNGSNEEIPDGYTPDEYYREKKAKKRIEQMSDEERKNLGLLTREESTKWYGAGGEGYGPLNVDEETQKTVDSVDNLKEEVDKTGERIQQTVDAVYETCDAIDETIKAANKTGEKIDELNKKVFGENKITDDKTSQFMDSLREALEINEGDTYSAFKSLGTNWEEVKKIFLEYRQLFDENAPVITPEMDDTKIKEEFEDFIKKWTDIDITWGLNANPNKAIATAKETKNKIDGMSASIQITGNSIWDTLTSKFKTTKLASGTRNHEGGLALVNDGSGAELLVDNGAAYIANGGKPAIVNLNKGAKVFTASETRSILGSGVPSYAEGTGGIVSSLISGLVNGTTSLIQFLSPGNAAGDVTASPFTEKEDKGKASGSSGGSGSNQKKEEAATFSTLKDLINYIINRIGEALDEQVGIIDKQIDELKAQRDAMQEQNKLEELQKAVADAQNDLLDALNERTVRYLGEDGQWHWMADARNVQKAQESLTKAQEDLTEYEDDLAFNARVDALEAQKTALQDEYKQITKAWSDIQSAVETPTGDLYHVLASVLASGTDAEKKGAGTVQNLLISNLLKGGSYAGNFDEALGALAKATAGSPIMPGESTATLASLIAMGAGGTGTEITDALKGMTSPVNMQGAYSGTMGEGVYTNYNYFINGLQLGSDQADQPLSSIMRNLTIYANTGVA